MGGQEMLLSADAPHFRGALCDWSLSVSNSTLTPSQQVIAAIRQGERPAVPQREALPGPDTTSWDGMDAYVQLMRRGADMAATTAAN